MNFSEKLKQPESRRLEFKRVLPEKSDLLKTIIAFANGSGGELIIGISDKKRDIVGVEDPFELEEKVTNMVFDNIRPHIAPFISVFSYQGKSVFIVSVLPGSDKPYYRKADGVETGVYIRIGSTNRRANRDQIRELRRSNRGLTYETETHITKSIDDLDRERVDRFLEESGQERFSENTLEKWKILARNNGDFFPTTAGLVLFGCEGLVDFDFADVRVTRYSGLTLSAIKQTITFPIPLVDRVDAIHDKVIEFIQKESILEGVRRKERPVIPEYAVRESIVNAIAHRDYSINGSSIKVNVFDDRVEIISPGTLYGNLEISDIGTGLSECRNRAIVRILRKLVMMEELGTGIARIFELYAERNLKKPTFFEQGQFFRVVLPQEKAYLDIVDRIYEIINQSGETTAAVVAEKTGIHRNTVLKHLKQLISQGKIKKTGTARNTKYYAIK